MMTSKDVSAIGYSLILIVRPSHFSRHCEEAVHVVASEMDCFAALAMTAYTIIITGFSTSRLNAPISSAPSAPSIER